MPQEQLEAIDQIAFYLGWVSFNFSERTIMANALVLDQNRRPTPGFLRLAQATGKFSKPLRPRGEEVFFHANECKRVFGWFAQLPHGQALPEQAGR